MHIVQKIDTRCLGCSSMHMRGLKKGSGAARENESEAGNSE